MADITDIQNAIKSLVVAACYPNGTANASIIDNAIQIGNGWPLPSTLDALLANNQAVISIYPHAMDRMTTRYLQGWKAQAATPATLTLTVAGQTVTVGGALPATFVAHNLSVTVQGVAYTYAVQPGDSLTAIASALASILDEGVPGTSSSGAVITVPANANLQGATVGTCGLATQEIRRQEKRFQISVWCNSPTTRDAITTPVDLALSSVFDDGDWSPRNFLSLPDGTQGRMRYSSTSISDSQQKARLYRRDLIYAVEYPTVQLQTATQIVAASTISIGSVAQST